MAEDAGFLKMELHLSRVIAIYPNTEINKEPLWPGRPITPRPDRISHQPPPLVLPKCTDSKGGSYQRGMLPRLGMPTSFLLMPDRYYPA